MVELEMDMIASLGKRINTLPLYSDCDIVSPTDADIHLTQTGPLVTVTGVGQVPGDDPAARMGNLSNFASHPSAPVRGAVIRKYHQSTGKRNG